MAETDQEAMRAALMELAARDFEKNAQEVKEAVIVLSRVLSGPAGEKFLEILDKNSPTSLGNTQSALESMVKFVVDYRRKKVGLPPQAQN